jgi:glutamate-ammonia-ligase adenylyltransferase
VNKGPLSAESLRRIERLRSASPLYALELTRRPGIAYWLEEPRNLLEPFRFSAFLETWAEFAPRPPEDSDEARLGALRQWRRLMSMRIAHRSVNAIADEPGTVEELTLLAEFCLRECLLLATRRWRERLGDPWDRAGGAPARFCILALGKLGGRELNFSSDIDLLYLYEGEGYCRRNGQQTSCSNEEFFTRVAETVTLWLGERTEDGFLFRADVRLRPDGAVGPLVRSLRSLEYYYSTSGQTWERLAMIKARPVAGSIELGAELLESLHAFRYPRRPPPSLIEEVAAMKARSEAEIVGVDALERDVKLGPGGIREIEFVAQSLQLLNAGHFPFLQTHSTAEALSLLARYGVMEAAEAAGLARAYWFLRRVEHRLQIREEDQTHRVPREAAETRSLAESLGFDSSQAFEAALTQARSDAHIVYSELFADRGLDDDLESWWSLLTTDRVSPGAMARLTAWFGPSAGGEAAEAVRVFARGGRHMPVTRELAVRFQHVARSFDVFHGELARPILTLARLSRFAERYGTRPQFLGFWAENPFLFRIFCVLFDRSESVAELLSGHPEIVEEVLRPQVLRRHVGSATLGEDIRLAAQAPGFRDWLWLYVRAEQVRYALGGIQGTLGPLETEAAISGLAEAVLRELCRDSGVVVVALGKFGSGELSFGSDLDLLFVAADGAEDQAAHTVDRVRAFLRRGGPMGPAFETDLRLRPHGPAGPLATSVAALNAYHRGGGGQLWERQALVRARVVAGPDELAELFESWRLRLLYDAPATRAEAGEIRAMRMKIEKELGMGPRGAAFKSGMGGISDIGFLTQALQLRHGHAHPGTRTAGTRQALRALADEGLIDREDATRLLHNYEFLRKAETALRLDANSAIVSLPSDEEGRRALARWLGFQDLQAFMGEHLSRMAQTRQIFDKTASLLELTDTP